MVYADGKKYVGEWKDDRISGYGNMLYANGLKYIGERHEGKRHGQGAMMYSDGSLFVGEWKEDKSEGVGTMLTADGRKYTGEWKDNELVSQYVEPVQEKPSHPVEPKHPVKQEPPVDQKQPDKEKEDLLRSQTFPASQTSQEEGKPVAEAKDKHIEAQNMAMANLDALPKKEDKPESELKYEVAELKEQLEKKNSKQEDAPNKALWIWNIAITAVLLAAVIVWLLFLR